MKKLFFHRLSVRRRLFLMTVLPLFIITALLTSYMVLTRQSDQEDVLSDRGSSLVRYLAGASEFGLFAGDNASLRRLANTMLKQEDVRAVRFFDPTGNLLITTSGSDQSGPVLAPEAELVVEDRKFDWVFQIPVYYSELVVDQFEGPNESSVDSDPLLGWVQLIMDERRMRLEQQTILVTSLTFAGVGFFGLFLLAGYVARGISRPISSLIYTVKQLESGQLNERANIKTSGELGDLAHGINKLAESVEISSEDLNTRVADATKLLTGTLETLEQKNKQLETTRKDLLKASAAKGEFLARMSHELRTPLTAVSGYAKLLQSMAHTDSQEEYLKSITGASSILLSTIEDILDFTRLETGAVRLEALRFKLKEALEDVLAMHALASHQKQLELVLLIAPDVPPYVIGDALRLRQILTNLISNALKFTDDGQVVLSASLMATTDDGAVLKFSIKDSGIGICEAHQAQLFDAFSQADQTIRRRFGGTGLGLAIAKELTRLMGGDIAISSQPGEGTEVEFTIRCGIACQPEALEVSGDVGLSSWAGKLFVYDKNPWVRRSLRSLIISSLSNLSVSASTQQLLQNIKHSCSNEDILLLGLAPDELDAQYLDRLLFEVRQDFKGPLILLAGIDISRVNELEDEYARFGPLYIRTKPIRSSKVLAVLKLAKSFKDGRRQVNEASFELNDPPGNNRLAGIKILVAEDNEFNLNLICAVVEAEGGVAVAAEDGVQALKEVHAQPIDIVLMDLNMPRLDGRVALQELRLSDEAVSQLPVIALTAEVLDGEDRELIDLGFNKVLLKPLDEDLLIDSIVELLEGRMSTAMLSHSPGGSKKSFLGALPQSLLDKEIARQLHLLRAAQNNEDLQKVRGQIHQFRSVLYGMDESDDVVSCVDALAQACDNRDIEAAGEELNKLEEKLSQSLGH